MQLPVDLLVKSDQLDVLISLMKHVPQLHGVIDHIAKPRIADGIWEPWATQMKELAQYPNLYCKLSGMVTEADHTGWQQEDFNAYIQTIIAYFGWDRIMYGSDWLVCLLAADYSEVMKLLIAALPEDVTGEQREKLFGNNALQFYRLNI